MDLKEMLKQAVEKKASDLHLTENTPPVLRIDGKLIHIKAEPLTKRSHLTRPRLTNAHLLLTIRFYDSAQSDRVVTGDCLKTRDFRLYCF